MTFRNSGRVLLATVVAFVLCFGITSCSNNYTVGYLYVTSSQYNQVQGFKIDNNHGKLNAISGSIKTSGGTNPIRMLTINGNRYLYVLNTGCGYTGQTACATAGTVTPGNISVFSIGGYGQVTFQQSFATQGHNPIRMQLDSGGTHLYVLDKLEPSTASDCVTDTAKGLACNGDITAFSVDGNTGRLTLITNLQATDSSGTNLSYFPVGRSPVDMKLVSGYLLIVDSYDQTVYPYSQNTSSGQLTVAQSGAQSTGASNISVIASGGSTVYLLDAGTTPSNILAYTVSSGALQAVNGYPVQNSSCVPNPTALLQESKGKFLYITNGGPGSGVSCPSGNISAYNVLTPITSISAPTGAPFDTGSGPQCLVEDPTNQYFYTANYNDGTVTAKQIDNSSGYLSPLHSGTSSSYNTSAQPTYCLAIAN